MPNQLLEHARDESNMTIPAPLETPRVNISPEIKLTTNDLLCFLIRGVDQLDAATSS